MKKSSLVILIALAWLLPFSVQAASIDDVEVEVIDIADDHTDEAIHHLGVPDDDEGPGHDARDNDDVDDEAHEREEEHENEREEDRESEQEDHSDDRNENDNS